MFKKKLPSTIVIGSLCALLFSGCSTLWPSKPLPAKTEVPVETGSVIVDTGKVVRVSLVARFVVMTFPIGIVPAIDRRLNVYRKGVKVAEIKVTGPQRDTDTVGDILSGNVEVNDEVRVE